MLTILLLASLLSGPTNAHANRLQEAHPCRLNGVVAEIYQIAMHEPGPKKYFVKEIKGNFSQMVRASNVSLTTAQATAEAICLPNGGSR